MRRHGDGRSRDERHSEWATVAGGLPMNSASCHLSTKLIMGVRRGGLRLTNRRTKLLAKRRSDCLHHTAPDVNHDTKWSYSRDRADTAVALDLTRNKTTREMSNRQQTATSAAAAPLAPKKPRNHRRKSKSQSNLRRNSTWARTNHMNTNR